jgi:hypothetical protein
LANRDCVPPPDFPEKVLQRQIAKAAYPAHFLSGITEA